MSSWLPAGPLWRLAERSVFWPMALMVIALSLVTWAARRRQAPQAAAARAVVFPVVVVLAFARIDAAWAFPPRQPLDFLPLFAAIAGVGDYLLPARAHPLRRRLPFAFLILTATAAVLLAPLASSQPLWVVGAALLVGIIGSASWRLLEDLDTKTTPAGLLPLAGMAAANLVIAPWTGSLLLGELSGSLAASLAVWMIGTDSRRPPQIPAGTGVRGFSIVFLSGLLLMEDAYSATPTDLLATLLAAVPLTALLVFLAGRHLPRAARLLLAAGACALPAAIALVMAHGLYVTQGGY